MAPRAVGLVASPRKGMNTDTLVTKALEGAAWEGAVTAKLYLNDLTIRPCQACANPPPEGHCVIRAPSLKSGSGAGTPTSTW